MQNIFVILQKWVRPLRPKRGGYTEPETRSELEIGYCKGQHKRVCGVEKGWLTTTHGRLLAHLFWTHNRPSIVQKIGDAWCFLSIRHGELVDGHLFLCKVKNVLIKWKNVIRRGKWDIITMTTLNDILVFRFNWL